ncbi:hypothetical protein S7711_07990 [Stachybotrys chartarum IBT 7711]|uniref:PH domain-containing protein n=1 Tax=Stachybotrys chartarum (strain CBS 109288 / IBT 7711) TaxID=1280523 RepID=A0A084AFB5_STACB|nr:hypothetical protein S7711_07990 [Stachybotrys chartarum IBT 7711]
MGLDAGTDTAVGSPTASSPTIPTSRYRTLRGGSVSSARRRVYDFDIFEDQTKVPESEPEPEPEPLPLPLREKLNRDPCQGDYAATVSSTANNGPQCGSRPPGPAAPTAPIPANLALAPKNSNLQALPTLKKNLQRSVASVTNVNVLDKPRSVPAIPRPHTAPASRPVTPLPVDHVSQRQALDQRACDDVNGQIAPQPQSPPPTPRSARRPETPKHPKDPHEADRWAQEVARLEAETDRILSEQKKCDLARLQAQLAASPPKKRSPSAGRTVFFFDRLNFFSRNKKPQLKQQPSQLVASSSLATTDFSFELSPPSSCESWPCQDSMAFIEPGGKGIVPQIDAPASASNGGGRRITVRYLSSTISLPVTNDTSCADILFSSANFMTHDIDPATSALVECYTAMGLERRLRRYERVREVMNSWDRDTQHSLMVVSLDGGEDARHLDIASVARTEAPPAGFILQLHHSSRRGRWTKRWITLLDSGQIFAAKKSDMKPSDKDSIPLCHLSDFDVYAPKDGDVRRHWKPPGKFCYAIKSQQKTIAFPDGENFVHFFSTDDASAARRFYDAVHGWRSWYIVNKMVQLEKKDCASNHSSQTRLAHREAANGPQGTADGNGKHRIKLSVDETPYTIGTFEPLLDLTRFDKPLEEFGKDVESEDKIDRQASKRSQKPKAAARHPPVPRAPPLPKADDEFSPTGLLGNAYEKRKQTVDTSQSPSQEKEDSPFTGGSSLLNKVVTSPTSIANSRSKTWFPSAEQHTARSRSNTQGQSNKPQPSPSQSSQGTRSVRRPATADNSAQARQAKQQTLVNLTDSFPEPPQHWREAQRGGVKPPAGAPLINFATGGAQPSPRDDGPARGLMRTASRSASSPQTHGAVHPSASARSRSVGPSSASRRDAAVPPVPPLPPLPSRSSRRQPIAPLGAAPSDRAPRHQEPLVNRAR